MTINGGRKYLILLIINDCSYLKKLTIICVKVCQRCANLCLTAQLCQSMSKCAKLCTTVPNGQDKFIFSG